MDGIYSFDGSSVKGMVWLIALILSVVLSIWFVPFVLRRVSRRQNDALPTFNYKQRLVSDAVGLLPDKTGRTVRRIIFAVGAFAICFLCSMIIALFATNPFIVEKAVVGRSLDAWVTTEISTGGVKHSVVNNSMARLVYCEIKVTPDGQIQAVNPQDIGAGYTLAVDHLPGYICYDADEMASSAYLMLEDVAKRPLYVLMTPAIYDKMPMPVR